MRKSLFFCSVFLLCSAACVRPASSLTAEPLSLGPSPTTPLTPTTSPEPNSTAAAPPTQLDSVNTATVEGSPSLTPTAPGEGLPAEVQVILIPLGGRINQPQADLSGMAWFEDTLVLLPQYPGHFEDAGQGAVFTLDKAGILAFLDGESTAPLVPREIPFIAPGLEDRIPGFEGFEAIAFSGERLYLTIEARPALMLSYLVAGWYETNLEAIHVDAGRLAEIDPQTDLANLGDESLVVFGRRLVTLYEANGTQVNPDPRAHLFTQDLELTTQLAFPNVEYRITDATPADENGRFWAINAFYPGDLQLFPAGDPLVDVFGEGLTHSQSPVVERLLEFQFTEQGVTLSGDPPLQLELASSGENRNWEAITRLDDLGFLLATDEFPATLLAFVPLDE